MRLRVRHVRTITEDKGTLTVASSDLAQQRQQVIRNALRVLAHDTTRVSTARVKVSQQGAVPLLKGLASLLQVVALGIDAVGDDVLDHGLGAAVGVGRTNWAVLGDGDHVGDSASITVNGGRGRKDNVGDVVALTGAKEGNAAANIDAVVLEGNLARLANGL